SSDELGSVSSKRAADKDTQGVDTSNIDNLNERIKTMEYKIEKILELLIKE
ncbi:3463_t:CDS:1, partial [Scutellospora calospora]